MEITRQADYAVRAVLEIARLPHGQRVSTSDIAKTQQIPPTFLAKIVAQLAVSGILNTTRGARGGVTLARPPAEINLLEVIEAIDGPLTLNACVSDPTVCAMGTDCPVHGIWCEAQSGLSARLRATNFAQLIDGNHGGGVTLAP